MLTSNQECFQRPTSAHNLTIIISNQDSDDFFFESFLYSGSFGFTIFYVLETVVNTIIKILKKT
jgi:hypothetical protein